MTESAETPVAAPALSAAVAGPETSVLAPGSRIGGYRIVEAIDEGPEAALYRVLPVAAGETRFRELSEGGVLVLGSARRGRIDPDRFAEAARRLAGIERSALARPLHGGVTSGRRVWAVYGDLAGHRLDAYCDEHRSILEQRVRWMIEVLGALAKAHSQLVLHGFLAPELVRVVEKDGVPEVVVLGFGLHALAGSGQAIDGPPDLLEGGLAMTPLSSPEELLGEPLSVASDVYRAGLLLLRLVLGDRAHGDLQLATDPESRVRAMVELSTSGPGERFQALDADEQATIAEARSTSPRALAEALQGELGRLVVSTLCEEADERPVSADALASRLLVLTSREVPLAGARGRSVRTGRDRRAVAAAALLAVLAAGVGWRSWSEASSSRQSADRARVEARVERSLLEAFGLTGWPEGGEAGAELPSGLESRFEREGAAFEIHTLDRLGEIAAARDELGRSLALHQRAYERAVEVYGEPSFEAAGSLLRGARSAVALGSEDAESWSRRAFHAIDGLSGERAVEALEAGLLLGDATVEEDPERALVLADRALEGLEAPRSGVLRWIGLRGPKPPAGIGLERIRLDAHRLKARALLAAGDFEGARAQVELAAAEPGAEQTPALAADLWGMRALVLERSGASAGERVSALERELEARTLSEGERAPSSLAVAERLAEALAFDGRLEGAIARAAHTAELAGEPARRGRAWQSAGSWQLDAGRPLDALASFERALPEFRAGSAESVRLTVLAANAALRGGRPAAALAHLDRVSEASGTGLDPGAEAALRAMRARSLAALGRSDAAVALREALDRLRLAEADSGPEAAPLLIALGEELTAEGEAIVAEAYLRRALTILAEAGAAKYLLAEAESALGEGLLAQGRIEEAGELLRRSAGLLAARDDEPAREAQRRLALLETSSAGS
ncbi:MAG TPA: hypothetical protein VMT85_10235 [Thermoanaerobaculia bacterium]|nr:hypothetical protein [Thermoanaerobaculia bacterium]